MTCFFKKEGKKVTRRGKDHPSSVDQRGSAGQTIGLLIIAHKPISIISRELVSTTLLGY
jgi:hypothetical protein